MQALQYAAKKIMARLHSERQVEAADIPIASTQPPRCYRAQSKEPNLIAAEWSDFTILALAACEKEEYGLARALLLEALDHSRNPELLYELAIVDWLDGALDAAIVGFEQSMGMGLDRVTVLHGLGQARIEQGNYDQGIADLTTVISEHPDELARAYARSTRALGFGGIRRFDEALRELNEAGADGVHAETPHHSQCHGEERHPVATGDGTSLCRGLGDHGLDGDRHCYANGVRNIFADDSEHALLGT